MMPGMLEGAIFDWDGVVVDSSPAHRESWERLAEERGLSLPENHFARSFGRKNALRPHRLVRNLGDVSVTFLEELWR